jgi:hypothetical protein
MWSDFESGYEVYVVYEGELNRNNIENVLGVDEYGDIGGQHMLTFAKEMWTEGMKRDGHSHAQFDIEIIDLTKEQIEGLKIAKQVVIEKIPPKTMPQKAEDKAVYGVGEPK